MDVFDTVSHAYHQKIAKDRANEEGIVVNPPSLGNLPGEGEVTYSSEVQEVLIPYTTREDSYNYYEVRNYVNDVNQENTQVLQTYDDELKARETYTYGNERLSYMNEQTKEEYQYLTDARGSVTGMTQDGELNSTNSYSVFGMSEEVDDTGNPYGYTGEAQDITGYNYLRARYYDSQTGTFLTQDSYEGEEDNPLSQNGYTYVENNPINYTDPTGHKKNIFQRAWSSVKKKASSAWNSTKKFVSNAWNSTKKFVSNAWNSAKKFVGNVFNGAKNVVSKALTGVQNFLSPAVARNYAAGYSSSFGGYYPTAAGAPISYGHNSYAQQVAFQTSQRQQYVSSAYAKATGNKGIPKTKEGQNLLKNWGDSLNNTLTNFCTKAKKAGKNIIETGASFGAGYIKQTLHNNNIVLPINSRLAMWLDQDWIKENPAYNNGIFFGKLAGLAQAMTEYVAAGLTFAAGTVGSGTFDLFVEVGSGGTATPAIPSMIAAEMALVTAATAAIGAHANMVMQNSLNGNNYSESKYSDWGGKNKQSDAEYHYNEHGNEVGAKDFNDYTRKADAFKDTVLKKGTKPKKMVQGKTPNVYRYEHNGKYIDLEHVMGTDLLGQPKILDYKIISHGTIK
ncbi:RHS repeat-associated core domain-containing protein [Enterococcus sp. AZ072]|uniref:RHS repeat-associated core domain-containing protein n=1 Tax=unclassified Enterococcus TaxID=2608891 RepID=UPI003D2A61A3